MNRSRENYKKYTIEDCLTCIDVKQNITRIDMNILEDKDIYYVQQGKFINKVSDRKLDDKKLFQYNYEEEIRMFKDFDISDNGISRIFIAKFNSPEECADFVEMHNKLVDKIKMLEHELDKVNKK
jgi:hypothetical protein